MQMKTKIVSSYSADSKPVKQEVNSTGILPPIVFPGLTDLGRQAGRLAGWLAGREIMYWTLSMVTKKVIV